MEAENIINYIKNVSKARVTGEKIKSKLRKKDFQMNETSIDSLSNSNELKLPKETSAKHVFGLTI